MENNQPGNLDGIFLMREFDESYPIIYIAECGDEIEMYVCDTDTYSAWCDQCQEYHVYEME